MSAILTATKHFQEIIECRSRTDFRLALQVEERFGATISMCGDETPRGGEHWHETEKPKVDISPVPDKDRDFLQDAENDRQSQD